MRLEPEHLARQLNKGIAPLYVILGDELLLIMEIADEIRTYARSRGYIEREIFTVDQRFDWSDLQRWGRQSSLFSERRILDIRIPSGKPGREGGMAIEALCRNLLPETIIIVTLPGIDKQGQASKWFKALEHAGIVIAVQPVKRDRLIHWIKQRLHQQGQVIDQDTLQFFMERVEGNLLAAHQEIMKLGLLHPPGRLSFEQVRHAILDVARYDVLQLPEAMLTADIVRYSRILLGLQGEGVAPPLILAVLAEQIRLLVRIRSAVDSMPGIPLARIMATHRVWPSRQKLIAEAIHRIDRRLLVQALRHAAGIDRMIKGVAKGDIWEELLSLGMYFAGNSSYYVTGSGGSLSKIN